MALKRKIPNSRVSLVMSEDDGFYYDEVISDEKGRFTFANTHYMDSTTLVFQAYNKKDKRNTTIEVDEIKYLPPLSLGFDEELWNSEAEDFNAIAQQAEKIKEIEDSLAQKNYQLLQQITVKAEKKRNPNKHYKIYNQPDEVIEVTEEYAGYLDVFEIVDKQIPGIRVQGFCPEIEVYIRGVRTLPNTMTKTTAEFLLDGMFVSANDLCSIDVTMIDKIEILKGNSAAVFGHRGMNGIIAVYLDQAGKRWEYVPVGIVKKEPKGYYRSREFYSPNYDTAPEQFEGPDYRNTLHWAPFITTGKDGKTSVSFFNSDDSGEYEITVEGISAEGGLGKSITSFSVKPDNLSNN